MTPKNILITFSYQDRKKTHNSRYFWLFLTKCLFTNTFYRLHSSYFSIFWMYSTDFHNHSRDKKQKKRGGIHPSRTLPRTIKSNYNYLLIGLSFLYTHNLILYYNNDNWQNRYQLNVRKMFWLILSRTRQNSTFFKNYNSQKIHIKRTFNYIVLYIYN